MDADFSVELGPPDEEAVLELPWDSGQANGPRYIDLKRHPEMIASLSEAIAYPEIAAFLGDANSSASVLETAKCDVWVDGELTAAEEIYDGRCKLAAYIDLVFAAVPDKHAKRNEREVSPRYSFPRHEQLAAALVERLQRAPELSAAVELIVRRCYYHQPGGQTESGYYLTAYVSGYGDDERAARRQWQLALAALGNAIVQLP